MIHGLYLYGRHVGLNEPGNGIIKVVIQDTPTEKPNDVVKAWVKAWHYGQTHMKCRWHREIVPKDHHDCNRTSSRKCFSCANKGHFKADCDQGKRCYKCGSDDHLARDCPGHYARETPEQSVAIENSISEPVTDSTPVQ